MRESSPAPKGIVLPLEPVKSIGQLAGLARSKMEPNAKRYERLAIIAAHNLGGREDATLDQAISLLHDNAIEVDEESLVDEINNVRDCELDEARKS